MSPLVLFAHGKESGPWGSKIRHLAALAERYGAQTLSPDYRDLNDPDARVERLLNFDLPEHSILIMVGSSMGGYVSSVASLALKPDGLFLMAPAFYLDGYRVQQPVSGAGLTSVVFGWNDEVIPVANGIRFAKEQRHELHLLNTDHRLQSVLPEIGFLFERLLCRLLAPQP